MLCTPHQISFGDHVKKTEMGRASSTYGGEERCIQGFNGETSGTQTTRKTEAQMGNNIKMDLTDVG